jgi:hypothetical protein
MVICEAVECETRLGQRYMLLSCCHTVRVVVFTQLLGVLHSLAWAKNTLWARACLVSVSFFAEVPNLLDLGYQCTYGGPQTAWLRVIVPTGVLNLHDHCSFGSNQPVWPGITAQKWPKIQQWLRIPSVQQRFKWCSVKNTFDGQCAPKITPFQSYFCSSC